MSKTKEEELSDLLTVEELEKNESWGWYVWWICVGAILLIFTPVSNWIIYVSALIISVKLERVIYWLKYR